VAVCPFPTLEAWLARLVDQALVVPVGVTGEDVVSRVWGEELVELAAFLGVLEVDPRAAFEGSDVLVPHGRVSGKVYQFRAAFGTGRPMVLNWGHLRVRSGKLSDSGSWGVEPDRVTFRGDREPESVPAGGAPSCPLFECLLDVLPERSLAALPDLVSRYVDLTPRAVCGGQHGGARLVVLCVESVAAP
jgi:hypothetical protein